jgi:hypothetical protein
MANTAYPRRRGDGRLASRPYEMGRKKTAFCKTMSNGSLFFEPDRYWAIIINFYEHVGAEAPGLGWDAEPRNHFGEASYQRLGDFGRGRVDEGRSPAFVGVGIEGELRNHDRLPLDIQKRQVHPAICIFKDAQVGDLVAKELGLSLAVVLTDPEQDDNSLADASDPFATHTHCRRADPLD